MSGRAPFPVQIREEFNNAEEILLDSLDELIGDDDVFDRVEKKVMLVFESLGGEMVRILKEAKDSRPEERAKQREKQIQKDLEGRPSPWKMDE